MTAAGAKERASQTLNIRIEHTPRNHNTQLTGIIDGHAFYEPLLM